MSTRNDSLLTVAVDGSALGNPGPAGWSWYIDDNTWAAGGWPKATNNQGELQAVIEILKATRGSLYDLHVLADSQYVLNSITKWMHGWKAKGWKKADGKPVLNKEFMVELAELLDEARSNGRHISFEWVKGHAGHALNEKADEHARAAASAFQQGAPPEVGPGLSSFSGQSPNPARSTLVTVSTELSESESEAIISAARAHGVQPREELANLIRFAIDQQYVSEKNTKRP